MCTLAKGSSGSSSIAMEMPIVIFFFRYNSPTQVICFTRRKRTTHITFPAKVLLDLQLSPMLTEVFPSMSGGFVQPLGFPSSMAMHETRFASVWAPCTRSGG